MDWSGIFGISTSPAELVVRGTAMYLFLFLVFRVVIRRRVGSVGMADILVLVIIADAAQNGMAGEYRSVTEGAILISTIIGWNVLLDFLTYKSTFLQKLLEPPPLLLVENGRVKRRNLRHEFISEDELKAKLREHGVTDYAQVKQAFLESEGEVSVIKK
jgi:uncharacterized membrane protein YcaP (DUF421 family)